MRTQDHPPHSGEDWFDLLDHLLPRHEVADWLVRSDCGASVVFTGSARDHSEGRPEVSRLLYEAYHDQAILRLREVGTETRLRFPSVARLVILHRVGEVPLGEAAVLVGAGSGHRDAAFDAARFAIDAVKATVPIWKRERWRDGDDWGLDGTGPVAAADVHAPRWRLDGEVTDATGGPDDAADATGPPARMST